MVGPLKSSYSQSLSTLQKFKLLNHAPQNRSRTGLVKQIEFTVAQLSKNFLPFLKNPLINFKFQIFLHLYMYWIKSRIRNPLPSLSYYLWPRPLHASYLSHAKSHVQFTFLTSFQRISPTRRHCERFSYAVSSYDDMLLVSCPPSKLGDTACRISATAYSVYYQPFSISGDHYLHHNLAVDHTVMTMKHSVQLMIHCNYRDSFYRRLVFLVALTVLLKKFTPQHYLTSIINTLLIMSLLLNSFWRSVPNWLPTDILVQEIKYITPKTCREGYTELLE
jgi:hypothetical protein